MEFPRGHSFSISPVTEEHQQSYCPTACVAEARTSTSHYPVGSWSTGMEELGWGVHARTETVTLHVTWWDVAEDHASPTRHVPEEFLQLSSAQPWSWASDELLLANHCHLLAALAFVIVQEQLSENEFKFHKDFSHDKPSCASITLIIVSTQTLILQSWRINIQVKQAAK